MVGVELTIALSCSAGTQYLGAISGAVAPDRLQGLLLISPLLLLGGVAPASILPRFFLRIWYCGVVMFLQQFFSNVLVSHVLVLPFVEPPPLELTN